jgi:mitofusin
MIFANNYTAHTRTALSSSIARSADGDHGIVYPGLLNAFQYADDLKEVMLSEISSAVTSCENHARGRTIDGVRAIQLLGEEHLGDEYADKNMVFKSDDMFQRKRDILTRHIEIETEIWDFFDWSTIVQKQEKVAGTGMAMTVATIVGGRMVGGFSWVDSALGAAKVVGSKNLRAMIIPGTLAVAVLAAAYILQQIPHSLPHRLATKISNQLAAIDYVHANSTRISSKARKVLLIPANNLRVGLQRSVEELGFKREDTRKVRDESSEARKYFSNLVNETTKIRNTVEAVDLEGPAPGVAASYDL